MKPGMVGPCRAEEFNGPEPWFNGGMTPQPYEGGPADIRMVVTDMDGTLLNSDHAIPHSFWALLEIMRERGVLMVPASGRQLAGITHLFPDTAGMAFIAENGTFVEMDGREVSSTTLNPEVVADAISRIRALGDMETGVVVCGKTSAYIERSEDAFVTEVSRYYGKLRIVDTLDEVDDDVLKVALFSFADIATAVYPHLGNLATHPQVVVSSPHWIDIMDPDVNKGVGLRALQKATGVGRHQTAVFGDYLNDLEMIEEADYSFAMANAHADVARRARFGAPSNDDAGVVTTVAQLLGVGVPA